MVRPQQLFPHMGEKVIQDCAHITAVKASMKESQVGIAIDVVGAKCVFVGFHCKLCGTKSEILKR